MRIPPALASAAACGVLIGALWLTTVQRVDSETAAALTAATRANANLAIAYEESVASALSEVDRVLQLAAVEYASDGPAAGRRLAQWPLNDALVQGLGIIGADGKPVFSTDLGGLGEQKARDHVAAHRADAAAGLHIGALADDPISGRWSIPVSRRVQRADGSFAGLVVAAMDPAYFTAFLRRGDLGSAGVVSLMGRDGTTWVRRAGGETTHGLDMRDSKLLRELARAPSGTFTGSGKLEGIVRLYSYRTMRDHPVVVLVGTDRREALAPVAGRARMYYITAAGATLVILLSALAISRTQSALRASGARLRTVFDSVNEGIVTYDPDLRVTGVNPAAERIIGLAAAELVGAPGFTSRLPCVNEDGSRLLSEQRPTQVTRRTGRAVTGQLIGITRSATLTQWLSVNTGVMRDPGNGALLGVVSTISDVTDERALQAVMLGLVSELEQNAAHLRATFDQALVAIGHAAPDGRMLRANRKMCELLGYSEAEILERSVRDFDHPEDRDRYARLMGTLVSRRDLSSLRPEVRRYLRKDGSDLWALASVSLVRKADGTPDYFIGMCQDVTELRRVEELKNEFISTVSHELRTPLTSIRGSLGLLSGGVAGALPGPARNLVEIAAANCERLIRLVNDILDVEKMDSGRMAFEPRTVALGPLLEKAVAANEGFARLHGVRLTLDAGDRPLHAHVDPDRFHQAITNFISNAVKYSPPQEPVEVRLLRRDHRARVEVRDRGPGIPLEFQTRIFRKFSQADGSDTRTKGGSGLGLCISKGIAERMGGAVGYETALGKGTTFFIEVPAVGAPLPPADPAPVPLEA